jgi:hypothetical protein
VIILIDGREYKLPAEVTLGERIEYENTYGKELRENKEIIDIEREVVLKTVSFFGKIPVDVLENTQYEDVLVIYDEVLHFFSDDIDFNAVHNVQREFVWNDEMWVLSEPELKQDSKILFGEFIDAKQSVQNGEANMWTALLSLCSIFLRKKGEPYDKNYAIEGPRMQLMKTLPLTYAIEVGFFLNSL